MVKKILGNCYLYLLLLILYLPVVLVIVYSFSNTANFTWSNGFTFDAYIAMFKSSKAPALWDAVKNTFIIAAVSGVASTVLGTTAAIGIFNYKRRARAVVESINQLPVVNSEVVMAVSLLLFFSSLQIPLGYPSLILGHISFCTPYVVLNILPRLEQMDPNIYEAALDLGANPFKAMIKVIIPYIFPSIVSGAVLAFALSMDDFIITQINKGAASGINTLSTFIYSDARVKGLEPFWFAVFSIIFIIMLTTLLVVNLRKQKKEDVK